MDLGNAESSTDIYFQYELSFIPDMMNAVLVPEAFIGDFNIEEAIELDASRYMEIENIESRNEIFLDDILDVNGDAIV